MNDLLWQPGVTLHKVEESIIKKALKFYDNNQTVTAESLGISVKTLYNKLKSYKDRDDAIASGQPVPEIIADEEEPVVQKKHKGK